MEDHLQVTVSDGVLRLTLNRPAVLNALTADMTDRLAAEVEDAAAREEVRLVLLSGAGGAFSSGADVSGPDAHESFDITSLDRANRVVRAITSLRKPCVAAVHGVAAGVGCSIALACDLVVAADSARFVLAFSRIGLMPDGGATATLAASVGRARAMRLSLLGEPFPGPEAYDAGLVSHLAPSDEVDAVVDALVRQLVTGPPLAFAAIKRAVNQATLPQLEVALENERSGQAVLLRTADAAEGMRAFTERRPPRFTGD